MTLPPWITERIGQHPPELQPYLKLHYHGLTKQTQAFEREDARQRLCPKHFAEIEAKLQRADLIAHPFHSVSTTFPSQLALVLVSPPDDEFRGHCALAVQEALQFFRDQLGLQVQFHSRGEILEPRLVQADFQTLVDNAGGLLNLALPRARRQRGKIWCFCLPPQEDGWLACGLTLRPNFVVVRTGPDTATVIAHELGHCLVGLADVQDSRPLEGPLSLMGYDWRGPVAYTYVGYRYKAACLTTPEAQVHVQQALLAERSRAWKRATHHYQQAITLDPWHLAAALRCLAVHKSAALALHIQERFPSTAIAVQVADILGHRWLPANQQSLGLAEHQELASWHRTRGRPGAAGRHLRQGDTPPPVWQLVQEACFAMNIPSQFHRAGPLLDQALARAPFDCNVRESKGIHLCYSGQPELAQIEFQRAVKYGGAPRWPLAYHYYLALARHQLPRLHQLLKRLDWPFQGGIVSYLLGDRPMAQELLQRAHQEKRTTLAAAYWHWSLGHGEQARQYAQRSLQRQLNRPYAWELLAVLEPHQDWAQQLFSWLPHWPTLLIPRGPLSKKLDPCIL